MTARSRLASGAGGRATRSSDVTASGRHEAIVPFVDDPDHVVFQSELEHGDDLVGHELAGHRATGQIRELLLAAEDVLFGLNDSKLI